MFKKIQWFLFQFFVPCQYHWLLNWVLKREREGGREGGKGGREGGRGRESGQIIQTSQTGSQNWYKLWEMEKKTKIKYQDTQVTVIQTLISPCTYCTLVHDSILAMVTLRLKNPLLCWASSLKDPRSACMDTERFIFPLCLTEGRAGGVGIPAVLWGFN